MAPKSANASLHGLFGLLRGELYLVKLFVTIDVINVQDAVEVVDLMLENLSQESIGLDTKWLALAI
jgi:hypothetical protein